MTEILDIDRESRESLEFDALLDLVAGHAATELGRRRIRGLVPSSDAVEAASRLATVAEAGRFLQIHGLVVGSGLQDPHGALERLRVAGAREEPTVLRELARVVVSAGEVRDRVLGSDADEFPLLHGIAGSIPDLRAIAEDVVRHVEPDGRLAEGASRELRRLRREVARVGERLRKQLEAILRRPGAAGASIRDDFVTQRNNRFVIPVRSDAAGIVAGIVHASSSSGATLFVEPLETVDLNNDLVRLHEAETEEENRILARWSAAFRDSIDDVAAAVEAVARFDSLQGRARYGAREDAVLPTVGDGLPLDLRALRHPLLDRRLRDTGGRCVPTDLRMDPADRVLVISGPNTGGKTVALKTLGLAVLMAQSGIPVPAASFSVPVFRQLRCDIGDHQSLEADLSTFSAHLGSVKRFLDDLTTPALLLFDEIGTGTDPEEGAALARAVLEALRRPGVTVAATTHHGAVKAWAFTADGVDSAALDFDTATMTPTFEIRMDRAGVSAGLDIARRLGLGDGIVHRARELIGEDGQAAEGYVARLRELTEQLERDREELAAAQADAARAGDDAREEAREQQRALLAIGQKRLDEAVDEFRERARRELSTIEERRQREFVRRAQREAEQRVAAERSRRRDAMKRRAFREPAATTAEVLIEPGRMVRVRSLDREGEIVAVRGEHIEVRLGRVGFTVGRGDLEPPERGATAPPATSPARAARDGKDDLTIEVTTELNLIGQRVADALPEVDRFLDGAARASLEEVRIVHGHGTGRLRKAIRRHLAGHAMVRRQRPGGPGEGGDGATVVELR